MMNPEDLSTKRWLEKEVAVLLNVFNKTAGWDERDEVI